MLLEEIIYEQQNFGDFFSTWLVRIINKTRFGTVPLFSVYSSK